MEDKSSEKRVQKVHTVMLQNREKIALTGITDVASFDEESIFLETEDVSLAIKGENLQITQLDLQTGDFCAEGNVNSITYGDRPKKSKRLMARLLG